MSIQFHVVERPYPGSGSNGPKKFYAQAISKDVMNIDTLTYRIEQISTVSGGDIRAVLYTLVEVVSDLLKDGHIVELGDLGRMRISIHSAGMETADEVNAGSVKKGRIIFRPGKMMQRMIKLLEFKKEATAPPEAEEPPAE